MFWYTQLLEIWCRVLRISWIKRDRTKRDSSDNFKSQQLNCSNALVNRVVVRWNRSIYSVAKMIKYHLSCGHQSLDSYRHYCIAEKYKVILWATAFPQHTSWINTLLEHDRRIPWSMYTVVDLTAQMNKQGRPTQPSHSYTPRYKPCYPAA